MRYCSPPSPLLFLVLILPIPNASGGGRDLHEPPSTNRPVAQCANDAYLECPDGEGGYVPVHRDPLNRCRLPADCPCPYEAKTCADGSSRRYRVPARGCGFDLCPEDEGADEEEVVCDIDVDKCGGEGGLVAAGYVRRDPADGCRFLPCVPENVIVHRDDACPMLWLCADTGRVVSGDPEDGCRPDCVASAAAASEGAGTDGDGGGDGGEESSAGEAEAEAAGGGGGGGAGSDKTAFAHYVTDYRTPPESVRANGAEDLESCDGEVRRCPGGHYVGRDPTRECQFTPCDEAVKLEGSDEPCMGYRKFATCEDGSRRYADPNDGCSIPPCNEGKGNKEGGEDDGGPIEEVETDAVHHDSAHEGKKGSQEVRCKSDRFTCPDGTIVHRDPNRRCKFRACPSGEHPTTGGGWPGKGGEDVESLASTQSRPPPGPEPPEFEEEQEQEQQEEATSTAEQGSEGGGAGGGGVPCVHLLPPRAVDYVHATDEDRTAVKLHSICDKYCNVDDCPSVLSPGRGRGLLRSGVLRMLGRGGADRGEGRGGGWWWWVYGGTYSRNLKDRRETCEILREIYGVDSGGIVLDCVSDDGRQR